MPKYDFFPLNKFTACFYSFAVSLDWIPMSLIKTMNGLTSWWMATSLYGQVSYNLADVSPFFINHTISPRNKMRFTADCGARIWRPGSMHVLNNRDDVIVN